MSKHKEVAYIWTSRDGDVIRCNSKTGYGPYNASSGCYQQIERLREESLHHWEERRETFRKNHSKHREIT